MKNLTLLLLLLFCTGWLLAQSSPVYSIRYDFEATNAEGERYRDLYEYTQVLEDPSGNWTYQDMLSKAGAFQPNTTQSQKDLRKVFWVKLQLQASKRDSFLFSVGKLYDDHNLVDVYYQSADSLVHQRSGYMLRPAEKSIRRSGSYFWIHLPADTLQTIYFRVDNLYLDCSCYDKHPVSVFHIDRQSVKYEQGFYVLPDFESDMFPTVRNAPRRVNLIRYFEFFPDPACNLELDEVLRQWDHLSYFRGFKARDLPLDTCHWARLRLINPKPVAQTRTFAYTWNHWDRIEYFLPDQEGRYQKFESFPNADNQKAFSFSVAPLDTLTLYIRYPKRNTSHVWNAAIFDIHTKDLSEYQSRAKYKYLFFGMLLFSLVYFFLQLIVTRDKLLFYYLLILVGLTPLILISLDRAGFFIHTNALYNLPEGINEYTEILARLMATYGFVKLTQVTLKLKRHLPLSHKITNWLILITLILTVINLIIWTLDWNGQLNTPRCLYCISIDISRKSAGFMAGVLLIIVIRAYIKKIPLSANFLIALMPVVLSIFWGSFLHWLLFPNFYTFDLELLGPFLTLLLFGVLIGARTNRIQMEKMESEKQKILLNNQLLQIESKALRAQMNPHFIFNCLNSIKSLIQDKANKQAVHYLTLFSKFIRQVLHHSEEKQISLEEELKMSRLYVEMEKLRFEKAFTYQVDVAPTVDTSFFKVPPMILQPFLENAIWHGLMHKEGEREIRLEIRLDGEGIKCIVEDNGIGRERAAMLNLSRKHQHRSFGTRLILDRLKVNKELFNSNFVVNIIDKATNGRATGTRVELSLGG